jgi:hypothetical protein
MLAARTVLRIVLALAMTLAAAAHVGAQEGPFTAAERASLAHGDLVTRPHRDARAIGGSSYQTVERTRADVWRAIHDVSAWRHMLPQTAETRLESGHGVEELVFVRHTYGIIQASYTLRVRFDEQARRASFEIEQARPHDVRSAHGFLEVRTYGEVPGRSLLVWAVAADPGDNPLVGMVAADIQTWSLRVPTTMRGYLQGSGRSLYGP